MELAQAFDGFNDELRGLLRDAAARDERDALALGELEAQKTNAVSRMGEIETVLKKAVDEGKVSHVRLPAFERGFRMRVGKDLAQSSFQEALTQRLPEAIRVEGRTDPEKIISDTYAEVSKQIGSDDLYARAAFDDIAQGVIAGFRQRAAEGYTAEFKRAAEQRIMDEGSEYLLQLATAPEGDVPAIRDTVKLHLDAIRNELPKSEVNGFFVSKVIAPTVDKLVSQEKFTEARHLLDEMDRLDVTGKGGMLSQTSVAKAVFSDLRAKIEREARYTEYDGFTRLKHSREALVLNGEDDAAKQLNQLRLSGSGRLNPEDRFRLIDEYRKANPSDPLRVQGFADAVHREYESEDKWRTNERALSDLEVSIKSLKKEDLAAGRARLEALYQANEIPPSARTRLSEYIDKLEALYGAVDEQDFNHFKKDLYPVVSVGSGLTATQSVNFGDANSGPESSVALWEKLSEPLRTQHELQTTEFFSQALQSEIRSIGDPNRVPAEKAQALDRATIKTRAYARTLLQDLVRQQKQTDAKEEVTQQARRIKQASLVYSVAREVTRTVHGDVPGDKPETTTETTTKEEEYQLPGNRSEYLASDFGKPRAEHNVTLLKLPGWYRGRWAVLPALAADALENPVPEARAKALELYGIAKAALGFTPEEVMAGKTAHGVAITASQIDPSLVCVFRNVAELNKHWNEGKPDETFTTLGDLLDPKDKMTAREFYLAQRALLRK